MEKKTFDVMEFVNSKKTDLLRWAVSGAVATIGYGLYHAYQKSQTSDLSEFEDREKVDCIPLYPKVVKCLIKLQNYKSLNKYLYNDLLEYIDRLLIIEQALIKNPKPLRTDKARAQKYFELVSTRLNIFLDMVKEKMDVEHEYVVNKIIKELHACIEVSYENIVRICFKIKPEHILERAKEQLEKKKRKKWEKRQLLLKQQQMMQPQ